MICIICSDYDIAKKVIKKTREKINNITFCGIEVEWGNTSLTEKDEGTNKVFNHHNDNNLLPPCLAYKELYTEENNIKFNENYFNFIISHIDADTLFGIGWASGIFKPTKLFKDLAKIISQMDLKGYHNIDKKLMDKYIKEFEVTMAIINHVKNSIKKIKFQNYYNCSSLIIKALFKISDILNDNDQINKRYNLIMKEKLSNNKENILFPESDDNIHIYSKKINDFNKGKHSFIISYNYSLSIYGRDEETVKKYIPEGLPIFLSKLVPDSGGQFSAAGTKRKIKVSKIMFKKIVYELKQRIKIKESK